MRSPEGQEFPNIGCYHAGFRLGITSDIAGAALPFENVGRDVVNELKFPYPMVARPRIQLG
jgi:hypothetical protein